MLTKFSKVDRIVSGKSWKTSKGRKNINMKRMNKVVSLTVATALLLSSMDMIGVKASENIIEDTDAVKEQPLQEVTEVQAVSASAPTVAVTNSKDFVIEKGVLTKYNGKEKNVVIPKGVTEIGADAFTNCTYIESVVIPEGVTKIRSDSSSSYEGAFSGCVKLKKVTLPKTMKIIGTRAFLECKSLESIELSNGVTEIGKAAFYGCSKLKKVELPVTIKTIGSHAFEECESLEQIKIPEGVKKLLGTFEGCRKLKSVTLPKTLETIESDAFRFCSSLESVVIPEGVTKIGNFAFDGCIKLKKVTLPKTLKTIGTSAFEECESLEQVKIPKGVTQIYGGAFEGCRKLKSVTLPKTLKTLRFDTFRECVSLESIVIPEGVTKMDYRVFYQCSKLKKVSLPKTLKTIGEGAFYQCKSLENIVLPDRVTEISAETFEGCGKLKKMNLPKILKTIGDKAFCQCKSLKQVKIPESVTKIGNRAFSGCTKLESVTLPKKVDLGTRVFENTRWQTKHPTLIIINHKLVEALGYKGAVTIPEGVTEIGDEAFYNNKDITSVKFPKSLKKIGSRAFYGCSKLKTIESSGSVKTIGDNTFDGTKWFKIQQNKNPMVILDEVLIDGTKCSGTITIPKGVTCINAVAFDDCKNLKMVKFPSGLKTIGANAFNNCTSLSVEKIKLPEGLQSIGEQAFLYTDGLYIKIPKSVTKIGEGAVGACDPCGEWLEENPDFTICGYSKTTAQTYAKKLGVEFVDIEKVTFEKKEMQKVYGDSSFTVKPTNNSKNVTYTSSDKKVATVTKSGKVTVKGCGKTYIAIKTPANGKKKASYKKVILGVCPQKVNLLSAVLQEKNRVKITWEKSKNAKGYCVEYSTDKDFKKSIKWYEEGIETVSSEFSVKSGQTYYIRVCACGESRYLYDDMYKYDLLGEYSEVKKVEVK